MMHDSGFARFYSVFRDESAPDKQASITLKAEQCFGDLTVGVTRFYQAAAVGQRVDRLIEIWRDDSITTRDICRIEDRYYIIRQATPSTNEDGLSVTRITLEESDGNGWRVWNENQKQ